ncbi:hypothetical protein DPMN_119569 [Dreissena polymorpha]|uniref:Uncharacterized protein n=1 Tax=Dreissena polymorpha TaxID=45954 RepID=A0A9D4JPI4_DREPO|nr:hypothetical protein DPMN_119569 [Dreissena polymorpha]
MYDDDGTSSSVTSNILKLDTKVKSRRLTPENITFAQKATTPTPITFTPRDTVQQEDASEFSYHRFIYGKATDNVCLETLPLGDHNLTSYRLYVRFHQAPSILDFDFEILIEEEHNWIYCIPPSQMFNHTGLTYFALHVPGYGKSHLYNKNCIYSNVRKNGQVSRALFKVYKSFLTNFNVFII